MSETGSEGEDHLSSCTENRQIDYGTDTEQIPSCSSSKHSSQESLSEQIFQDLELLIEEEQQINYVEKQKLIKDQNGETKKVIIKENIRITSPWINKFEKARVLGIRAREISMNSPLYVDIQAGERSKLNALQIAEREYAAKKIPFILRRKLPNGFYEDWSLRQLNTLE